MSGYLAQDFLDLFLIVKKISFKKRAIEIDSYWITRFLVIYFCPYLLTIRSRSLKFYTIVCERALFRKTLILTVRFIAETQVSLVKKSFNYLKLLFCKNFESQPAIYSKNTMFLGS